MSFEKKTNQSKRNGTITATFENTDYYANLNSYMCVSLIIITTKYKYTNLLIRARHDVL